MPYTDVTGMRETGEPSYLGDALPVYTQWVDLIKSLGGTVTTWPFSGDASGKPAARFDVATYVALFNGGKIDAKAQQQASSSNQFVYVLAPVDVATSAKKLVNVTAREAANLPGGSSGWNPFANVSRTTKIVAGAAVVTAAASFLGLFRGRR